jgi:dTDP-4-amino-4,6-dideoxygalactose transaminase
MKIPLFDLNFGQEEEQAAVDAIRSGWISMGPRTREFEERFAAMHESLHAIAVTNCTAALHLALRVCGVGPGDEVIVPSLTFVATASCVRMVGAEPVFADVASLDDWTISVRDVEHKITSRTKAVIPMHYGGYGADMAGICGLAKKRGLKVIEDACHAPLGRRDGRFLGTFGDFGCYSFYSNKNMTTGEGGMMLTQNAEYAERARLLRAHGMTATAYDREQGKEFYDVVDWGYNYRIDDIRAAIGLAQLEKLEADIEKRAFLANRYRSNLSSVPRIHVPFPDYQGESSNYVFGVLLKNADRALVRGSMQDAGIGTSMHYPPVHRFDCYFDEAVDLPTTEEIGEKELSLPLYATLKPGQVDLICERLIGMLGNCCV